nr:MAG TPA: hypothetical protein [Caudoviricetes sp.]
MKKTIQNKYRLTYIYYIFIISLAFLAAISQFTSIPEPMLYHVSWLSLYCNTFQHHKFDFSLCGSKTTFLITFTPPR